MMKHACLILLVALGACDKPKPPTLPAAEHLIVELSAQKVMLAGRPFTLEVATTDAETERGLMYRRSMPADHGMLFVFAREQPRNFWMRNTLIPLDIAYLDSAGTVLNVAQMTPLDETGVPSAGPMRYAIELNQGTAARIGLRRGDHVDLPPVAR